MITLSVYLSIRVDNTAVVSRAENEKVLCPNIQSVQESSLMANNFFSGYRYC